MESSMEFFSTRLGDLVSDERKKTGKSQNAIASDIGISSGALSQYISEKREPGAIALIKIAQYFNISPNDLLFADGEKWNDDDSDEELLCAKIHSYTGLSKDAIKILHEEKEEPFFILVVNTLIEENADGGDMLLDDIVSYMTTDLWNDLGNKNIYNALPGSAFDIAMENGEKTSTYKEREGLILISAKLQKVKKYFYEHRICDNKKSKRDCLKLFAMKNIRLGDVLRILYPLGTLEFMREKQVDLSEQFMDGYESMLRQDYELEHPEIKDYKGFVPKCYLDVNEYLYSTAVTSTRPSDDELSWRREQAYNFMKEYVEYSRSKTAK